MNNALAKHVRWKHSHEADAVNFLQSIRQRRKKHGHKNGNKQANDKEPTAALDSDDESINNHADNEDAIGEQGAQ